MVRPDAGAVGMHAVVCELEFEIGALRRGEPDNILRSPRRRRKFNTVSMRDSELVSVCVQCDALRTTIDNAQFYALACIRDQQRLPERVRERAPVQYEVIARRIGDVILAMHRSRYETRIIIDLYAFGQFLVQIEIMQVVFLVVVVSQRHRRGTHVAGANIHCL